MYFRPQEIQDFLRLITEHKSYALLALLLIGGVLWFNWSQYFRFRRVVNQSKHLLSSLYLIIVILNVFYLMVTTYKGSLYKGEESNGSPYKGEENKGPLDTSQQFPQKKNGVLGVGGYGGIGSEASWPLCGKALSPTFTAKMRDVMNKVKTRKQIRNVSNLKKKIVAANQHWKCGLCGELLDETYEVDHIVPLYQGGSNDLENLMALDPRCHKKKTFRQQYLGVGDTACPPKPPRQDHM